MKRTYLFVHSGTVRSALSVCLGSILKKRNRMLIYILKVKKQKNEKKRNLPSETVCSALSVHPGAVSKKKWLKSFL